MDPEGAQQELNQPLMVNWRLQQPQWPNIYRSGVITFRAIAIILLALAAGRMGTANQDVYFPNQEIHTFTCHDYPTFMYFMSVNILACVFSLVLQFISVYQKDKTMWVQTLISSIDVVMVALLFSANGAALALYLLSYNGLSIESLSWNAMCDTLFIFCSQVLNAITVSLCGSVAYTIAIVFNHVNYGTLA
ncbi:hypothetical protein LUZ61_017645 [Rhynchospora tenuis]|uniref:CASP-like protein n=1 Tax=Rhynchospora tenuis TaxID=198213 RepID=A0AAD5Z7X5_9POAL|nr:hypothetical protein LUZ61_017645 [Rhynchospora tenuis]